MLALRLAVDTAFLVLCPWFLLLLLPHRSALAADPCFVYASGNEVGAGANNIKCFHFDPATRLLTPAVDSPGGMGPGYLAWTPGGGFLYALNTSAPEVAAGSNAVAAFRIDHVTGALTRINAALSGGTGGIVHLCKHPLGTGSTSTSAAVIVSWVFVTHYSTNGETSSLPVYGDGHVGAPISTVHAGQYAHQVLTNAAGTRLYVPCLGANHIRVFDIAANGVLTLNRTVGISQTLINRGPRHAAFDADESHLYVINEVDNTMTTFTHTIANGDLVERANTTTLPLGSTSPSKCAHVLLSPNGATLFGSNRRKDTTGTSSLVSYGVHAGSGALSAPVFETASGQIMHPRDFAMDADGTALLVASRGDDGTTTAGWLNVFRITPATGALSSHVRTMLTNRPDFVGVMRKVRVLDGIRVDPPTRTLFLAQTQDFNVVGVDQFGADLSSAPTVTWSITAGNGSGSIDAGTGVLTASAHGSVTVKATDSAVPARSATATVTIANRAPTLATAATATPATVTGVSTALAVLGQDDLAESALIYTWATVGTPPSVVAFSATGSNAAKACTATFTTAGSYQVRATVTDGNGASVDSATVTVTVAQTPTTLRIDPLAPSLATSASIALAAIRRDQFAHDILPPVGATWTVSAGAGSVDGAGVFTAPASTGTSTVTASAGGRSATRDLTIVAAGGPPGGGGDGGGGGGCGLGAGWAALLLGLLLGLRAQARWR